MDKGDDIYLLRLIATTETKNGTAVPELDAQTSNKVLKKINRIVRRGVFEEKVINWIDESNKCGLFKQRRQEDKEEYLDTLFQLSRSKFHGKKVPLLAQEVLGQKKQR